MMRKMMMIRNKKPGFVFVCSVQAYVYEMSSGYETFCWNKSSRTNVFTHASPTVSDSGYHIVFTVQNHITALVQMYLNIKKNRHMKACSFHCI